MDDTAEERSGHLSQTDTRRGASLKPCPVCRKQVSTQATACPRCGHPIDGRTWTSGSKLPKAELSSWDRGWRNVLIGCLAFPFVAASLLAIFASFQPHRDTISVRSAGYPDWPFAAAEVSLKCERRRMQNVAGQYTDRPV